MGKTLRLNTGKYIPLIGFGTWQVTPDSVAEAAVSAALKAGYRLIDTAQMYNNEQGVGKAIRKADIKRDEIFVTTKLWTDHLGYQSALDAFDISLDRLGLEYVDLYLIHWPATFGSKDLETNQRLRQDTWRALEEIYKGGRVRNIGASNFVVSHLEELLRYASVLPAVNQIELHPFIYEEQRSIVEFCQKYDITVEAYSPLSQGGHVNDPAVLRVAEAHHKTGAQILIRWAVQHGTIPLPRSTNPQHILENKEIFDFELTSDEMSALDKLTDGTTRVAPDPHTLK